MRDVQIIRNRQEAPPVSEMVKFVHDGHMQYREIFHNQLEDMLSWLAGTQRFHVLPGSVLISNEPSVIHARTAIYQTVQDLYPGGLPEFLETFPRD